MRIVVIGGSGLIGSKLVDKLREKGHEVMAASPKTGVNTLTGEGLGQALAGAQVVVDVSNSPSFEDKPAWDFFTTSGRNLLAAEKAAGVQLHVALSVVGTDRLQESGYFRAKLAQEKLVQESGIPFTIVRSTQFFEFLRSIAQAATSADGQAVHLSGAAFQPIAAEDVASFLADAALGPALGRIIDIAGPERAGLVEFVRRYLSAVGDSRLVVVDPTATYSGVVIDDRSLVPLGDARLGPTHLKEWISAEARRAA